MSTYFSRRPIGYFRFENLRRQCCRQKCSIRMAKFFLGLAAEKEKKVNDRFPRHDEIGWSDLIGVRVKRYLIEIQPLPYYIYWMLQMVARVL